jgi:hypothetical protein
MIRVKILYDGEGPGHTARIVDAETGELISGAFRAEIDATGVPMATIYAYMPIIDVTTNARLIYVCADCRRAFREQEIRDLSDENFMQEYLADFRE